jgi:nucleoside-diphosphate-sugar epimerase
MINVSKIAALPGRLGSKDLGLIPYALDELQRTLTKGDFRCLAVNFTLGGRSFENQHIRGIHNLICSASRAGDPRRPSSTFAPPFLVAAGSLLPATSAEAPIPDLSQAQPMGYARSKLVAERIVHAATEQTGMVAKVLRVGQIVGDTITGKWNATEAIPLMLRIAITLKALPALDETPSWLPVDVVADAVLELTRINSNGNTQQLSDDSGIVFHVQNAKTFRWTEDLLPALKQAGLEFEILPRRQWVQRSREGGQDPAKNPAVKLLDFFVEKYDNDNTSRAGFQFYMDKAQDASPPLRGGVELIESGLVRKFVDVWRRTEWMS